MKFKGDEMLKVNLLEFTFRVIPEMVIINYGIIMLSEEKKIQIREYIISSIISSILVDLVRQLPISFGLHIIINIMITISILSIMGLPLIKSIYNAFFMYFIFSSSELINILILDLFNINFYMNDANIVRKLVLGIPSLFITIIFLFIIKFILKKGEVGMSIIENIAFNFGELAQKKLNVDSDEAEIITYGATNLLLTINAILWVLIVGFFTGTLYEALLFSITSSILRKYSGGVHASSPMRCTIIGATISGICGIFVNRIFYKSNIKIVIAFCIFSIITSLIIMKRHAPVDSLAKPIDEDSKIIFKKKSIILVMIITIVIITIFFINMKYCRDIYIKSIESMAIGILWQSFTLTKMGIRLLTKVDLGLKYIMQRR